MYEFNCVEDEYVTFDSWKKDELKIFNEFGAETTQQLRAFIDLVKNPSFSSWHIYFDSKT